MSTKVLVAYASRHGSTRSIAERIAETMTTQEIDAIALPVDAVREADGYDGYVVGSAVYGMHWLGGAKRFVHRNREGLRRHPVWLFSSGPLSSDPVDQGDAAPREVAALQREIDARGHETFTGAYRRDARPIGVLESVLAHVPAAREALPDGDYRDWAAIDRYASSVAGELELALSVE